MTLSPLPRTEPPQELRAEYPDWWNAPVPAFGDPDAWLAIVGLAPGKHGANRTGRPFTGDFAGELLYATLAKFGLSEGNFAADPTDGLRLTGAMVINAVRCLPPANKPTPEEIRTCRPFLEAPVAALPKVRVFIALGSIAHDSAVRTLGGKPSAMKFGHLAVHPLPCGRVLIDSYHCSRYNQNTRKLTPAMFEAVFARAVEMRDG
jgi:uracil-DNA glycosylase family 4